MNPFANALLAKLSAGAPAAKRSALGALLPNGWDGGLGGANDQVLAHLTPKEAALLHFLGPGGSTNSNTGLLAFDDGEKKAKGAPPLEIVANMLSRGFAGASGLPVKLNVKTQKYYPVIANASNYKLLPDGKTYYSPKNKKFWSKAKSKRKAKAKPKA